MTPTIAEQIETRRHEFRTAATQRLRQARSMTPVHSEEIVDDVLNAVLPLVVAALEAEEDNAGAECSRLEADILDIHDVLVEAGYEGAINAESVRERLEQILSERERRRDLARAAIADTSTLPSHSGSAA